MTPKSSQCWTGWGWWQESALARTPPSRIDHPLSPQACSSSPLTSYPAFSAQTKQCVCDKLFLRQLMEGILPLPNSHICCLKGLIGFFTFCPAGGYEVTKRISEIDSESLSWYSDFTANEQSNSRKVIISHFNKQRNCVHFKEWTGDFSE